MTEQEKETTVSNPVEAVVMAKFCGGLTVKQLKEVIKDWPEVNEHTGEDCEVWIGGNGISNQCKLIAPLNRRFYKGEVSADILLTTQIYK
jgi:hypothetical protein